MNREKLIGPYTVHNYGSGRIAAWRHGWRDGRGQFDRTRNVIGGYFRGRITDAGRLPA